MLKVPHSSWAMRLNLKAAALCMSLLFFFSISTAAADVARGVEKYKEGDYEAAISEWLVDAGRNDPYALFFLGQVYRLGRGVDVDLGVAEYYYQRAAKLNHVPAQGNLGTLYYFAESPLRRVEEGIGWWRVAARNGDARSQYMLSVLYFNGDNVEKNWPLAFAWVTLAEENGVEEAKSARSKIESHLNDAQLAKADQLRDEIVQALSSQKVAQKEERQIAQNTVPAEAREPTPPPTPSLAEIAPKEGGSTRTSAAPTVQRSDERAVLKDVWRVQIGAYRTAETAGQTWVALKQRYEELLGPYQLFTEKVELSEKGIFHRTQIGLFDAREAAKDLCNQLDSLGQSCYVVKSPL